MQQLFCVISMFQLRELNNKIVEAIRKCIQLNTHKHTHTTEYYYFVQQERGDLGVSNVVWVCVASRPERS